MTKQSGKKWKLDKCLSSSMDLLQSAIYSKKSASEDYYEVINEHKDYEERFYPTAIYVCTLVKNVYQDAAKTEAFRTLQSYTRGNNVDGACLKMKPPILTQVVCDTEIAFERKFIVCAYLSDDVTDTFPKPTNKNVFIKTLPDMTVFVKSFEGVTSDERWTLETRQFTETLKQRENIRTDFFITATYDSPFHLVSTRNEIWLVKYRNQTHKALAEDVQKTETVQIGSSKMEVPSIVSWFLYAVMMYISFVVLAVKSVVNPGVFIRKNWSSIKRNALTTYNQMKSVLKWDNLKLATQIGVTVSKSLTKFSFNFVSALSESAGFSWKKPS